MRRALLARRVLARACNCLSEAAGDRSRARSAARCTMGLLRWLDRLDDRFLHRQPELAADERIIHSWPANWQKSPSFGTSGLVHLTTRRVLFLPSRFSWSGDSWACGLEEIRTASREPPDISLVPFLGNYYPRLSVVLHDGSAQFFSMYKPEGAAEQISRMSSRTTRDPSSAKSRPCTRLSRGPPTRAILVG